MALFHGEYDDQLKADRKAKSRRYYILVITANVGKGFQCKVIAGNIDDKTN